MTQIPIKTRQVYNLLFCSTGLSIKFDDRFKAHFKSLHSTDFGPTSIFRLESENILESGPSLQILSVQEFWLWRTSVSHEMDVNEEYCLLCQVALQFFVALVVSLNTLALI